MSSSTQQQPQAVPQAPDAIPGGPPSPVPTPPPKSAARLSDATNATATSSAHANSPRMPPSSSPAPGVPTMAPPASIPHATAPQGAATETEERLSYNDKLNAADRYWKFKFGLKAAAIITGLIGVGCFGWLMSTMDSEYDPDSSYSISYESYWSLWPSLITWAASIVWCALCIIVFLLRKRPVHPGVRVAMDLLLWLGFIVTALFSLIALRYLMRWGLDGFDTWGWGYSYSSDGEYVLASNNTWVWEQDTSYIETPRDCSRSSQFDSCEEQDAFVNKLWAEKDHRSNVTLTGVVCQFFGLVIHFALFVWACVDCHRHRRRTTSKDAEKLAAEIVQNMISNGAVVPPPGQAHMKPQPGQVMYYQMPPNQQGYPNQPPYMQQGPGQMQQFGQQFGQHPQMTQPVQRMAPGQYPKGQPSMAASDLPEKIAGSRYA
ncbi:uncharacterized protein J4E87_006929 [Alternaria ethzedia]|uniref:uncharacterized protein n=1 Tax=Alternaria ethzedia TaxID=181014 RepID=UPI0020C5AA56|nr:uncharacterized protein J4E87_006929 [Alternaria ethzedia]KAI4621301.1 hypothetical protein J4E87_006929 [Alternaria ethzedia]